ncbi:MAG: FixH family protein [Planctomycetota bacterium]
MPPQPTSTMAQPQYGTNAFRRAERRAKRLWLSGVVALLGTQIVIGAFSIYLSKSDPTVAVVPNYYHNAVNWDATRRGFELMRDLGWQVAIVDSSHAAGQASFSIALTDEEEPVSDRRITGKLFHHALAQERHQVRFQETRPGVYRVDLPAGKTGLWQLNLRIEGEHGIAIWESTHQAKFARASQVQ